MLRLIPCLLTAVVLTACDRDPYIKPQLPHYAGIGNAAHGKQLIEYYGCGSCHSMRGVPNAVGLVGPPLNGFAKRIYIAGMLRNTPDNLVRWIEEPQAIVPGNVMPNMGIDSADAHDIAAYLYAKK